MAAIAVKVLNRMLDLRPRDPFASPDRPEEAGTSFASPSSMQHAAMCPSARDATTGRAHASQLAIQTAL